MRDWWAWADTKASVVSKALTSNWTILRRTKYNRNDPTSDMLQERNFRS